MFGALFWFVILAYFGVRCARRMKEPGANRKGYLAALLLYATWFAVMASATLISANMPLAGALVGLTSIIVLILGVTAAVSALLEIRAEPQRYTTGRGTAIRSLVSAAVLCTLFGIGVWTGFSNARRRSKLTEVAAPPAAPIERPDLNFRVQGLARPWVEMDAKKLNPDAAVAFARTHPDMYFQIIAEKTAFEITPEAAIETWKARVESLCTSVSFVGARPTQVNGLSGLRATATAKLGEVDIAYVDVAIVHNGFVYQLLAWSAGRHEAFLNKEADKVFASFHIIDPAARVGSRRTPAQTYVSKDFGYTINAGGLPWTEWRALAQEMPHAEFGALCGERTAMAVVPVPLLGFKADVADVDGALVSLMDFDRTKAVQRAPIERGAWRGFEATYERNSSRGNPYRYRLRTLVGSQVALLAAEWRPVEQTLQECPALLDSLVLGDVPAIAKDKVPRPAAVAQFFNNLGLTAFRAGRWEPARAAFEQAHALVPTDADYVSNIVETFSRQGKKQAALEWLVNAVKGTECSSPMRATEASLLADLGKAPEAIAVWTSLFGCGYLEDSTFADYAHFLEAHGKAALAIKEAEKYAARQDSTDIALLRADLLSRKGERDNAIALLEERQKKKGFDSSIAYRLGELALDAERPAEAIRLCEDMVSRGLTYKSVRVLQARAEYRLKWYAHAKTSLELALKADPADQSVQRFLDHVSAVLGEGKNTAIKEPIDAVPLPAALADSAPDPGDHGRSAAYLLRATAMSFVHGKDLRKTEYRRIRVLDETGVSRFSTMEFRFDPLSEALYVNKLEVKDPSGAVTTSSASEAYVSDEASAELATQRRTLYIPIPGLRPGSTIEIVLTRRDLVPPDHMEFSENQLAGWYPIGRSVLFVSGDAAQVESRATPGLLPKRMANGLAWVIESPPVYRWEPYQPPMDDFLPTVWLGNSSSSWEGVGKDYLRALDKLLSPDGAVREAARKLERQPFALARFVQKELTYKAIEFGRGARIPRAPSEVLRHRYGDCKDHALLLYHLLRNAGVDAQLALVRTGSPVRRELPSLDQFDHMVVYLPASASFVDTTNKSADLSRGVTPAIAGKDALILDAKQSRLMRIPEQGDDAGEMSLVREARVVAGADLEISETATFRGNEAAGMRAYLDEIEPKARLNALQRRLSVNGHAVEVLALDVRELREPQKPLSVQIKYVEHGAFHAVGGHLVGRIPALLERGRIDVERSERETPFEFDEPLTIHSSISLELPSGYAPAQPLARRISPDGPFAAWKVVPEDASAGRALGARFDYARKRGRHKPAEFADLRRDTDAALGAIEQEVVLQPVALGQK
jgi:transglutaminase-like putative cysteine protease/tetratricopeptide (TPR) repeat protein